MRGPQAYIRNGPTGDSGPQPTFVDGAEKWRQGAQHAYFGTAETELAISSLLFDVAMAGYIKS